MNTGPRPLNELFAQLGLDGSEAAISAFLDRQAVPPGQSLCDAPFWSAAQAQFLREAIAADAEWSSAVDELAARLAKPRPAGG